MKLSFLKRPNSIKEIPQPPKQLSLDTITKYGYSRDIDTTSTKPRVAILMFGNMRYNSLNPDYTADNIILDSVKMHFLNDEFKSKYDYDVFISTDKISLDKAFEFYGNNLRNVHITETNEYLHQCRSNIPDYTYFRDNYLKKDFKRLPNFIDSIFQYYRLYCTYNMMTNFMNDNNIKYDYIVRTRPDSRIMQPIVPIFNTLNNSDDIKLFTEVEQLIISKFQFHDIFKFICYYGDYFGHKDQVNGNNTFSPEGQYFAHIGSTLKNNGGFHYPKSVIIMRPGNYNILYRGNGVYGYTNQTIPAPDTPGFVWNGSMFKEVK